MTGLVDRLRRQRVPLLRRLARVPHERERRAGVGRNETTVDVEPHRRLEVADSEGDVVEAPDAGTLKVVKVNVDDNPVLARRFDARSIPTMVVLKDGQPVELHAGRYGPYVKHAGVNATIPDRERAFVFDQGTSPSRALATRPPR